MSLTDAQLWGELRSTLHQEPAILGRTPSRSLRAFEDYSTFHTPDTLVSHVLADIIVQMRDPQEALRYLFDRKPSQGWSFAMVAYLVESHPDQVALDLNSPYFEVESCSYPQVEAAIGMDFAEELMEPIRYYPRFGLYQDDYGTVANAFKAFSKADYGPPFNLLVSYMLRKYPSLPLANFNNWVKRGNHPAQWGLIPPTVLENLNSWDDLLLIAPDSHEESYILPGWTSAAHFHSRTVTPGSARLAYREQVVRGYFAVGSLYLAVPSLTPNQDLWLYIKHTLLLAWYCFANEDAPLPINARMVLRETPPKGAEGTSLDPFVWTKEVEDFFDRAIARYITGESSGDG